MAGSQLGISRDERSESSAASLVPAGSNAGEALKGPNLAQSRDLRDPLEKVSCLLGKIEHRRAYELLVRVDLRASQHQGLVLLAAQIGVGGRIPAGLASHLEDGCHELAGRDTR